MAANDALAKIGNPESDPYWVEVHARADGKMLVDVTISADEKHWPNVTKYLHASDASAAIAQVAMTAEVFLGQKLDVDPDIQEHKGGYRWHCEVDPKGKKPEQLAQLAMEAMESAKKQAHDKLDDIHDPKAPKFVESGPRHAPMPGYETLRPRAAHTEGLEPQLQPDTRPKPKSIGTL